MPLDPSEYVMPMTKSQANLVKSKVDRWREENPNALHTWTTKSGGCVVQFWGMRIFYGRCPDCTGLVTARRDIARHRRGETNIGRWPLYCTDCREARRQADSDKARTRMARVRAGRARAGRRVDAAEVIRMRQSKEFDAKERELDNLYGGPEWREKWRHADDDLG